MSLDGYVEVPNTVESKKPYYEKRVTLFEQYKARELENIEKVRLRKFGVAIFSSRRYFYQ